MHTHKEEPVAGAGRQSRAYPEQAAAVTYKCEARKVANNRRYDCGEPSHALYRSECACGHARERWACEPCAAGPGICSLCLDAGHQCPVTITAVSEPSP